MQVTGAAYFLHIFIVLEELRDNRIHVRRLLLQLHASLQNHKQADEQACKKPSQSQANVILLLTKNLLMHGACQAIGRV